MPENDEAPRTDKSSSFLQRKVGPLPTWGWIVAGAVGVAVFLYIRSRRKSAGPAGEVSSQFAPGPSGPSEVGSAPGDPYGLGQGSDLLSGSSSLGGQLQGIQSSLATLQAGQASSQAAGTATTPNGTPPPSQPTGSTQGGFPFLSSAGWIDFPSDPSRGQGIYLGTVTGPGGTYQGYNVSGGAPVYALVNGKWQQGFNASQLPVGTPLATLAGNRSQVGNYSSSEKL